jgi:PAS domain S-box-containing protein
LSLLSKELDFSTVLDRLEAIIYIADMETYEVIYINEHTKDIYGDIVGKTCWQSLHSGRTGPCTFCTNSKLVDVKGNPNGEYKWEFHNAANGKWYDIRNKAIRNADGRLLRLEIATDITHRKHAEQTFKLTESAWKNIFDAIPDSVVVLDLDYKIIKANKTTAELFGTTPEEIIGRRCYEVFHGSNAPVVGCPRSKLLQTQRTVSEEIYDPQKGRYLSITDSPIFENGKLKASVHIVKDITIRKRIENALQLSQFSLERCADTVYWMGPDARFIYANNAASQNLGYTREELLSMSIFDINPIFPREKWSVHWDMVKKLGHVITESMHRTKDGRLIPVEVMTNFITSEEKEYVCTFARDITERKQAVSALKTSEEKFSKAFISSPDMIVISSLTEGRIVEVNEGFLRKLGFRREDVIGKTSSELNLWVNSQDRIKYTDILRSEKEIKEFEADVRNKSGEVLSCLLSAGLIELDGEPHILSVARDITEHKKALKTGHLASIGELSAGIAHEINNPTNSIMLNAEMLLDMPELEADERNDIASSIRKDSQRITNIVKSLLSFARADCKEKSPVNINTIMRDALMLTQQQIGKSGIDLTISISPDIPEITANAQEMEQVFINIINNARYALNQKYPSNKCDKKLVISASPIEIDSTPYLQLIFYDTGTGISRDIIKKVKDPFFTTKPVNAGTGLGMSISHGIISDHKGTLEIESKEGEYTRIIIKLPVEVENEPAGSFD